MYRTAIRSAARPVARSLRAPTKRFASTASPADRPKTWKGSALRWGLAGAALYYYNTSPVFADEAISRTVAAPPTFAADELPTVDSVIEEKRKQVQQKTKTEKKAEAPAAASNTADAKAATEPATDKASQAVAVEEDAGAPEEGIGALGGGAGALEEEAGQQGAFNPETGEINWDCPCLGGMAHGPCGEEFKTAFSCFVYSTEEPKGMDCIEKFQGMQECFRQYPEIYGAELAEEEAALQEDQAEAPLAEQQAIPDNLSSQKVQDVVPATHDATVANDAKPADAEVPAPAADLKVTSSEEPKQEDKQEKKE